MICEGAARNSGFAISTRLTNSHRSRPLTTDTVPARFLWRAPWNMSVADLRHAGQEQAIDREVLRDVAESFQRVDELGELRFRYLSGRLEIGSLDEKIIGLLDFRLLNFAHLHQNLHCFVAIFWV